MTHAYPYRAHEPDIDRAAEGLSRAAPAAVAGAADAGVRARHRARRGHGRRQSSCSSSCARSCAEPRKTTSAPRDRRSGAAVVSPARAVSRREQFSGHGRARSGAHRCCRSGNGSSRDGAPEQARAFEAALAEVQAERQRRRPRGRDPQVPARRSRRDRQDRHAGAGRRQAAGAGPHRPAQCRRGPAVDRLRAAGARGAGYARQPAARPVAGAFANPRLPR